LTTPFRPSANALKTAAKATSGRALRLYLNDRRPRLSIALKLPAAALFDHALDPGGRAFRPRFRPRRPRFSIALEPSPGSRPLNLRGRPRTWPGRRLRSARSRRQPDLRGRPGPRRGRPRTWPGRRLRSARSRRQPAHDVGRGQARVFELAEIPTIDGGRGDPDRSSRRRPAHDVGRGQARVFELAGIPTIDGQDPRPRRRRIARADPAMSSRDVDRGARRSRTIDGQGRGQDAGELTAATSIEDPGAPK